jgi:hypothetical protein
MNCEHCKKEIKECECKIQELVGNEGFTSATTFGTSDNMEYSFLQMDKKIVLKLKLFNDFIYLGKSGIEFLHNITKDYVNISKAMYEKQLLDWDCNSCGKKTNNGQEWCEDCIDNDRMCD